jgi:glycosyltransferase involved in cell wall biosynthesis
MNDKQFNSYIYPLSAMEGISNPYIHHFIGALENNFNFLNRHKPTTTGIFDLIKYFNKIRFIFLNWIEDLPIKKGGTIQVWFLICSIYYFKIRKVKVIYTLHNKESHHEKRVKLSEFLYQFLAQKADYIITHSKEGVELARKLSNNKRTDRIIFFHHPVLPLKKISPPLTKEYDILLWGTVAPYKGIEHFLDFIKNSELSDLRILIAGKITRSWLREKIYSFQNERIKIIDRYISYEERENYILQSKIVLFTYTETSILSSGALMDTLVYAPVIAGPDVGSFRDLAEEGLIFTYKDFENLKALLPTLLSIKRSETEKIRTFCAENSWEEFGRFLSKRLIC